MIHLEIQYFTINRILLLVIGLWPYQQSKFTRFQFIVLSIILISGIIFQLTTLMTSKCTLNLISKILSSTSYFIFCTIIYDSFCINIKAVKDLLMQLEHICNQVKDKNEVAIIEEHNYTARRHTITLTVFVVIAGFISTIGQYLSNLIVLPKNISRLPITMEYFIDQEKYFYLILLHIYAIICIGAVAILAIGTMFLTYLQYIYGMFRIARLSKHLMSTIEVTIFCLIAFGVVCLTLNLFQIASSENTVSEFCLPLLYVVAMILCMFISNYVGQNIIDHNNYVFSTAYNVQWYRAPLRIQRMILFLLQREAKEFTLNVSGVFNASMECFAMLVKTSVSYFTVIYSMR